MPETRTLTVTRAIALAEVLRVAQASAHVARLMDGYVYQGTARSIGDERGNFSTVDDDVRDEFLRVTLDTGLEAFWPVSELIEDQLAGLFAEYSR